MELRGILAKKRTKKFSFGKHDVWLFEPEDVEEAVGFMEKRNKEGCSCRIDKLKGDKIVACHCSCYEEKE